MRTYACGLLVIGLAAMVGAAVSPASAQGMSSGWNIQPGSAGRMLTLSYASPRTQLGIESQLEIDVNDQGLATGGMVTFATGLQRSMTPLEAQTYYADLDGPQAVWNYWESHGMLATLTENAPVPPDWFGRESRVMTVAGPVVVGSLATSNQPGDDELQVPGAPNPVLVSMNAVRDLEELK